MPDATVRFASPYPIRSGVGSPRLWTDGDDLMVTFPDPEMAMDAAPLIARGAARGARDDNDNGTSIVSSPTQAAMLKLFAYLGDRLSPEDLEEASGLVQQLLGASSDDGTPAIAGDRHPGVQSYAERFPNQGRLHKGVYR